MWKGFVLVKQTNRVIILAGDIVHRVYVWRIRFVLILRSVLYSYLVEDVVIFFKERVCEKCEVF